MSLITISMLFMELVGGFGCLTIGILFAMNGDLWVALAMAIPAACGLIFAKRMTVELYDEFKI